MLKYLARYTHRVAISNRRLISLDDGEVAFQRKDYAHGGGPKTMTLKAVEFIRRFLLHVLPSGFVRIRHYGFLANRVCREKLALCRTLLGVGAAAVPVESEPSTKPKDTVEGATASNICPSCGEGRIVVVASFRAIPVNLRQWGLILEQAEFDTS